MEIKYLEPIELIKHKNYMNDILDILVECDKEFIPPLSSRNSTRQTNFNYTETDTRPMEYFKMITQQNNILTIQDGVVIAFMSYIYNYDKDEFFNKENVNDINNYITTICVRKEFRGKGLAEKMYEYIEDTLLKKIESPYISTRTWSTNIPHINLLKKRNYENTHTIKNDRSLEDGTKVDTIYFGKNLRRYKN